MDIKLQSKPLIAGPESRQWFCIIICDLKMFARSKHKKNKPDPIEGKPAATRGKKSVQEHDA